jgi:murein DD-endopeptidase MepM/ murein hydrolase activator NlpD
MQQHNVQRGDTLSAIARKYQVSIADIQSQNPQITDINHIQAGWQLKIPSNDSGAESAGSTMPAPKISGSASSTDTTCTACASEFAEVIHVMGASDDEWCLALPQSAAEELYQELTEMDALMSEFKAAQDADDTSDEAGEEPGPKRQWMIKAAEKGVIAPIEDEPEEEPGKASEVQSRIAALDEQIRWFEDYDPGYFFSFTGGDDSKREDILTEAKEQRLTMLKQERATLQKKLEKGNVSSGVRRPNVKASDFSRSRSAMDAGVVEVMVFSRPGRWHYVRKGVYARLLATYASIRYVRKSRNISELLKNKKATAAELIGKIRDDLAKDAEKSPIGNVEVKFAEASKDVYLLGEEHTKLSWSSGNGDSDAQTTLQVSAEAQLMRFAMQASAGINSFDLSTGDVDIGAKASASMALAEAEAKLAEVFVPDKAGWDCRFTYRNRNGELSDLAFGAFRLSGDVTLNCFVGGKASTEGNVKLSTGAATFLLSDKKKVEPGQNGLSLSGNAFAGAEAGGAVSGRFCWVHPDEQFKDNADWKELLKIEAGGTVALGIGAGLDFSLSVVRNRIVFGCKGRLVFGPGASGSFGTVVGADAAWDLLAATVEVLRESDFQFINNIEPTLYSQWAGSLYLGIVSSMSDISDLITDPAYFRMMWGRREERKLEAHRLARSVIRQARDSGSLDGMNFKGIPYSSLPPETMGMMLYTLTQTFIESREEDQETAILLVISTITTWRQFFEVLQHMSPDGEKVNASGGLEEICAVLDDGLVDNQLSQFQRWIMSGLSAKPSFKSHELAWKKIPVQQKNQRITQRLAMLNGSNRYSNYA